MILEISPLADFLTTIALSGSPVATSVYSMPLAIIKTAANTNTTSAIPAIVIIVVSFREPKFLIEYLNGIAIFNSFVNSFFNDT